MNPTISITIKTGPCCSALQSRTEISKCYSVTICYCTCSALIAAVVVVAAAAAAKTTTDRVPVLYICFSDALVGFL